MDRYPQNHGARCWIIDPIDGTQNFVRGLFPAFGVSIAFAASGRAVAGGVAVPALGDAFLAERGGGAHRNGAPLRVSTTPCLSVARAEVDFANQDLREETMRRLGGVLLRAGQIRCHCAAVIGLCSIATGDADGYFHVGLSPWDHAAATLIVDEAGGQSTRFDGSPIELFGADRSLLATNGRIHPECVAAVDG